MSLQIASYEAQKNNLSRKVTVVPSFEIGVRIPVPSESFFSLNRCRNRNSKKGVAEMGVLPGTVELDDTRCIITSVSSATEVA